MSLNQEIFNRMIDECNKVVAKNIRLSDNATLPAKLSDIAKCEIITDAELSDISIKMDNFECSYLQADCFRIANRFRVVNGLRNIVIEAPDAFDLGDPDYQFDVEITKAMQSLAKFVAKDITRPNINGVCIDYSNNKITATDGHVLKIYNINIFNAKGDAADRFILINAKDFKNIVGTCHIDVYKDSYIITCTANGLKITGKIEGHYPNYIGVLPRVSRAGRVVIADSKAFAKAAKRYAKCDDIAITCERGNDYFEISSDTKNDRIYLCTPLCNDFCIKADGRNLNRVLDNFGGTIWITSNTTPIIIDNDGCCTMFALKYKSIADDVTYFEPDCRALDRNKEPQSVPALPAVQVETVQPQSVPALPAVQVETAQPQSVPALPAVQVETAQPQSVPALPAVQVETAQPQSVPALPAVLKTITIKERRRRPRLIRFARIAAAAILYIVLSIYVCSIETGPAEASIVPPATIASDTTSTSSPATIASDTTSTEVPATIAYDTTSTAVPETIASDTTSTAVPATVAADTASTAVPETIAADTTSTAVPETIASDTILIAVPATVAADTASTIIIDFQKNYTIKNKNLRPRNRRNRYIAMNNIIMLVILNSKKIDNIRKNFEISIAKKMKSGSQPDINQICKSRTVREIVSLACDMVDRLGCGSPTKSERSEAIGLLSGLILHNAKYITL